VLAAVRVWRREHAAAVLADFAGLLALDNVTGDVPALRRNAAEIVARLRARGAEAEAVGPDGVAPLVIGRVPARPGAPRLGLYAHYDGQPVTPADWSTPPFEPTLVAPEGTTVPFPPPGAPVDDEWRLHARAAADDKAPVAALLAALDALAAAAAAGTAGTAGTEREVELVLCLEGEEESGSTHLGELLAEHADRLAADAWLICDGPVQPDNAPQVVLGVRGFTDLELTVYGPARELHSGHYGNWAPNPALELARLLASMKDAAGRVTIDGFTADTRPPSAAEQAALDTMPAVEDGLLDRLGLAAAEVPGSRLLDRLMLPSLNVRGLRAADVGPAARNVIPASATASLDIRLAAGDDPARMLERVRRHVERQGYLVLGREPTPDERRTCRLLARIDARVGYPAARAPLDLPVVGHLVDLAGRAANRAADRPAVALPTLGGSVPLHHFGEALDTPAVILPIANPDNNQHAADENLRLGNLWYGVDLLALLLTTPWRGAAEPADRGGRPGVAEPAGRADRRPA
jgi:acetylornithine deacetylase/succinyl-diaminopimelate desuccinylase-like protein